MFSSKTKKVVFKVKPISVAKGQSGEKYFVKIGKDKTHSYTSGNNGVVPFNTDAERFYRIGNLVKTRVFLPEHEKIVLYREDPKRRHPIKVGETIINYVDFLSESKVYADFVLHDKEGKHTTLRLCIKRTWKHEYTETDKKEVDICEYSDNDNDSNEVESSESD